MLENTPQNFSEFQQIILNDKAVCFYLSTPDCNVCKVLKPKVKELIETKFSQIKFVYVNLNEAKEIAGQLSVFAVPTIIIFFDGKEVIRVSRNISLDVIEEQIERYYKFIFE